MILIRDDLDIDIAATIALILYRLMILSYLVLSGLITYLLS